MSTYADEVRTIVDGFDFELCSECGEDLDKHSIAPDPLGHPHAWCMPYVPPYAAITTHKPPES